MTLGSGEKNGRGHNLPRLAVQNGSRRGQRHLLDLPDDVIYVILSFCDLHTLGRLSQVCRHTRYLVNQDCVWLSLKRSLTQVRDCRWKADKGPNSRFSVKEQCRLATNWLRSHCRDSRLIYHSVKQLPWLQFDDHYLWASYKNLIRCYRQMGDGTLSEIPMKTLRGHRDDVSRFVIKDNMIVSGSRDRSIHAYSALSGECLVQLRGCHAGDIQAVDCFQEIAISGSRDATVKVWNLREHGTEAAHIKTIAANDRVWSIAMNPNGRSFATGTAGINHSQPLRIWDTESTQLLAVLGNHYKYGAGVLDIQYETPDILLSCGYDTFVRLWDLRKSHTQCALIWEEPFDSTLYCVKSDGNHAVVTGTARHGMVRLWDKRQTTPVQLYYAGRASSPVYSVAYDMGHLYVALDKGINMLDFTVPG